jgi:NAD+ synthase
MQKEIMDALHVQPEIDVEKTIRYIIDFVKDYVRRAKAKGLVLGISGGQDSTLAGYLCARAVDELREETGEGHMFIALRLPYGSQLDEDDCQDAIKFIGPDFTHTVDIKPAVDATVRSLGFDISDFGKGNIKARERMVVQYAYAGQMGLLVVGTDHAAEAVTGFFTKFGDGAADILPIAGLTKRQGKALLKHLGCPSHLYEKEPTADLEDNRPRLSDEEALGLTYEQIDDYLEGKEVREEIAQKIESYYQRTAHKRALPQSRFDA